MKRIKRSDIKSIENLSGSKIFELTEGQVFYETEKSYEIWNEAPLFRVKRFNRKNISWVNTY